MMARNQMLFGDAEATQDISISFRDGRSGQLRTAVLPMRPVAAQSEAAEETELDLLMAMRWRNER